MRTILIILLFPIAGCDRTSDLQSEEKELVVKLIEEFITQDSLNYYGVIETSLEAYEYYEYKYTKEGYRIPHPDGHQWMNESLLIELNKSNRYFVDSATQNHVKTQIINSKKTIDQYDLSSIPFEKKEPEFKGKSSFYIFYLPIFNIDSTAAYIQYDHFDNGYGEGNAAVFVKKNGKWKYVEFIPIWIT